jgi:hypothetical protein
VSGAVSGYLLFAVGTGGSGERFGLSNIRLVQKTSHTPNSAQKDLDFCYDVLLGILEGLKHRDTVVL